MGNKNCSITVTTTDGKEITIKCTSQYLATARTTISRLQRDIPHDVVRIWKLGKSDRNVLPTKAAVNKLLDILQYANASEGILDLVWDDMIDLKVEYPPPTPEFISLGTDLIFRVDNIKNIILRECENKV